MCDMWGWNWWHRMGCRLHACMLGSDADSCRDSSAGCPAQVTDASGASLASHCPSLAAVKLTKAMTDSTIRQLAQHCPQLQEADLHRCGDAPAACIACLSCSWQQFLAWNTRACTLPCTSTIVLLTSDMCGVWTVGCCRCTRVSCAALLELLQGCKQLHKLVLPLQLDLAPLLVGLSHSLEEDEEQERQVLLLHQRMP